MFLKRLLRSLRRLSRFLNLQLKPFLAIGRIVPPMWTSRGTYVGFVGLVMCESPSLLKMLEPTAREQSEGAKCLDTWLCVQAFDLVALVRERARRRVYLARTRRHFKKWRRSYISTFLNSKCACARFACVRIKVLFI